MIHHGRILAMGTLDELSRQYNQADLEELFFELISRSGEPILA
jgi:ABC-type Na+ transport system ATPase subunit NatA